MQSFIQTKNKNMIQQAALDYFKTQQGISIANIDKVVNDVTGLIVQLHKNNPDVTLKDLNREAVQKIIQVVVNLYRSRNKTQPDNVEQSRKERERLSEGSRKQTPPPPAGASTLLLAIDPRNEKKEPLKDILYTDIIPDTVQDKIETQQQTNQVVQDYITYKTIVIDSRERNDAVYADPYNYQIELSTTFKNITSAELKSAELPRSEYAINSSNNLLHFEETTGTVLTATLTAGNYDADELAAQLKTALDDAGASTYTVTQNSNTFKYTIVSNGAGGGGVMNLRFNSGTTEPIHEDITQRVKYRTNSIGKTIGFSKTDKTGALTYTSDFRYNLGGEMRVFMFVEELIGNVHGATSDSGAENAFAEISFNVGLDTVKSYYGGVNDARNIKKYDPPLGSLRQMHISFKTHDQRYYDFNKIDHTLTIELGMINNNLVPISFR